MKTSQEFAELIQRVECSFHSTFSRDPTVIAAAPGRVNLIGEHIDYNDGFVLPMAIERYVVIAAAKANKSDGTFANIHSLDLKEARRIPLRYTSGPTVSGWGRYVEGVIAGFISRGIEVPPFNAVVASNVPLGGGLSSSAALEVATATALEALAGVSIEPIDKALLCQQAEHVYAGVPCGIMDQFSSVFGQPNHLMLIDCRSQEHEMVPFDSSEVSILITNSNVRHKLTGGEYSTRRSECESALTKIEKQSWRDVSLTDIDTAKNSLSPAEFRRARHVVTEISRTCDAATAIRSSDWEAIGGLMHTSHVSLRDDFRVSCRELDVLVEIASRMGMERGVIGSRMTGGGFGGCTVSLVRTDKLAAVTDALRTGYTTATGLSCDCFASFPARGAHIVKGQ